VPHIRLPIDGAFTHDRSKARIKAGNPATETVIATLSAGRFACAGRAIAAARRAQPAWSRLPAILIAPVMAIGDLGEGLAETNSGDYGLSACMVTKAIRRLMQTARDLGPGQDQCPRRLRRTGAGHRLRREEPGPVGEDCRHRSKGYLEEMTMDINRADA
jgi:hypothetical protein